MSALILVVQHDLLLREVISEILDAAGHCTFVADDASKALDYLENHPFDLLVTCPHPHPINGVALAIEAKTLQPKLPIILVGPGLKKDAALPFIAAIIQSPFSEDELRKVIKRVLQEASC